MAIFVCSFKMIKRSEGRSAVAAAAYRSGEKITNQWDGVEHDYTKKGRVVYKRVMLPENAPDTYKDRATLWNAVELAEKSSDSRLCRECLLALPQELSRQEQIKLVEEYVKKNFVELGMCADIAIHDPILTDDLHRPIDADGNPTTDPAKFQYNNPHAHILLTIRPIDIKGNWEAKTQKEYLCKRNEEQHGFTADEFKNAKSQGWEKQYRYLTQDGKKEWMTPTEAAASGLSAQDRTSRSPRSTPYGRKNPTTAYWNDTDRIVKWRKSWADIINAKFQALKIDKSVDHRSYADQGIDRISQEHLGSYANTAEKRAARLKREGTAADKIHYTEIGNLNRQIRSYNNSAQAYRKTDKIIGRKITATAKRLEHLRAQLIYNSCVESVIGSGLSLAIDSARQKETDIQQCMQVIDTLSRLNEKSLDLIASLAQALAETPTWRPKYRELQNQLNEEKSKIRDRENYVKSLLNKYGIKDTDTLYKAAAQQSKKVQELTIKSNQMAEAEKSYATASDEYVQISSSIPDAFQDMLADDRLAERTTSEAAIREQLHSLQDSFPVSEYDATVRKVDKHLSEKNNSESYRKTRRL